LGSLKNFESCSKVVDQDNFDVLESSNTLVISILLERISYLFVEEHFQSPYKVAKGPVHYVLHGSQTVPDSQFRACKYAQETSFKRPTKKK